jgi:hypothetical protein
MDLLVELQVIDRGGALEPTVRLRVSSTFVQVHVVEVNRRGACGDDGKITWGESDEPVIGGGDGAQISDGCCLLQLSTGHFDAVDRLAGCQEILEIEETAIVGPGGVANTLDGESSPAFRGPVEEAQGTLIEGHGGDVAAVGREARTEKSC